MSIQNLTGQTLGQYELRDLLGAGGMGAVYRGYQSSLKRYVAVKVLAANLAEQPGALERFNREAQTSAALEHANIIRIYDYGTQRGISYLVMQLLGGGSLQERLAQRAETDRPLPSLGEIAGLLNQLASALDYAHSEGVIHRDIKPSNVMFDNHGSAFLVDFGIAKLMQATSGLTASGMVVGTWGYMAPEQWKAETLSPATDQYALAVMTYSLITGQMPFEAPTPAGVMHRHLNEMPTPVHARRPDVPEAVTQVIERALAKRQGDRFPTVTAFAQGFDRSIRGQTGEVTGFFTAAVRRKPQPAAVLPTPSQPVTAARPIYKHPLVWGLVAVLLAALGVIAVLVLGGGKNPEKPGATSAAQIASDTPAVPTPPPGIVIFSPVPSPQPTGSPEPSTAPPIIIQPSATPFPTATETPDLNATALALAAQHLTETAESWTDTPVPTATITLTETATPDLLATVEAMAAAVMTGTAEAYTATPTVTLTPTEFPLTIQAIEDQTVEVGQQFTIVAHFTGPKPLIGSGAFPADESIAGGFQAQGLTADTFSFILTAYQPGSTLVTVIIEDEANTRASVTFMVTVTAATASPTPIAAASSAAGLIAFESERDGNQEIYVMNADGSSPRNLTNILAADAIPAWSPDGSQIAFVSVRDGNGEIYVINADGSDPRNLTQNSAGDAYPDWSPDGSRITFTSDRDGNLEIYVMNADGSDPRRLTSDSGDDGLPAWSPDGSQIAFESTRDGNLEIYVMNADGSDPRRLTSASGDDVYPDWSPDGSQIVFDSMRDGNAEIYVMNADGSSPRRLTDNSAADYFPDWSPDGSQIAFTSYRDGNYEVYVMNADGSDPRNLTQNSAGDYAPVWQPAPGTFVLPTATPAPTVPAEGVWARLQVDRLNVRSGPGTNYDVIGQLTPDVLWPVLGTNASRDWLVVEYFSAQGWITATLVDVQGDLNTLPIVAPPPTPLPPSPTPLPAAGADIVITSARFDPPVLVAGQPFSCWVTVRNAGDQAAGQFAVAASFPPGDVFAASIVPGLAGGQSIEVELRATVSGTGSYTFAVVADLNGEVAETDETNDLYYLTYTITPAITPLPTAEVPTVSYLEIYDRRGEYTLAEAQVEAGAAFADPLKFTDSILQPVADPLTLYAQDQLEATLARGLGLSAADARRLILSQRGLRVYTSVDLKYQVAAYNIAQGEVAQISANNVSEAAVVILRPDTGEILAMVGSVVDGSAINMALVPRQIGSAMGPFVYAAALEHGLTPADVIWDTAVSIPTGGVEYAPLNYDGQFHGPLRMRDALANSYNIPAVQTLRQAGIENLLGLMSRFGVTTLGSDPSRYGLSLALGGGEVTPLELTAAYAVLANGGRYVPPTAIVCVADSAGNVIYEYNGQCPAGTARTGQSASVAAAGQPVLDPRLAFVISDILADNNARAPAMGTNSALRTPDLPTSVKTGTTSDSKDSWTVGYTRNLAIGVWMGNADGTPMANVSGLSGAAPLWNRLMTASYEDPALNAALASSLPDDAHLQPRGGMSLRQLCSLALLRDPALECTWFVEEWVLDGPAQVPNGSGGLIPAVQIPTLAPSTTGPLITRIEPGVARALVVPVAPDVADAIATSDSTGRTVPPLYCLVPQEIAAQVSSAQEQVFILPPSDESDAFFARRWAAAYGIAVLPQFACDAQMLPGLSSMTPAPASFFPGGSPNAAWTPVSQTFGGAEMVLVPAGCFIMGSTRDQIEADFQQCEEILGTGGCDRAWFDHESPAHAVCLSEFWIDQTEVTNAQYGALGAFPGDNRPRDSVIWAEAEAFCQSRGARLPTEAEWEYAARGPDGWKYPWGSDFVDANVNSGTTGGGQTEDVGSRPGGVSWVGALDMSGNLWEWTADWYGPYPDESQQDPSGPASGTTRVARGGSWDNISSYVTTATRWSVAGDYRDDNIGFRCASSPGETALAPEATEEVALSEATEEVIPPAEATEEVIPPAEATEEVIPAGEFTGVIVLDAGALLNVRRGPGVDNEVLAQIPGGTPVMILGRNGDGVWLQVEYQVDSVTTLGWVMAQYVTITRGGVAYPLKDVPVVSGEVDTLGG